MMYCCCDPGQLDERQQKLQKEVVDAKNGVSFITVSRTD